MRAIPARGEEGPVMIQVGDHLPQATFRTIGPLSLIHI